MSNHEAKDRLASYRLDKTRPNPKGILPETIKVEQGYREPFYRATTAEGKTYCFIDWVQDPKEVMSYYYAHRYGDGLAFQAELQRELNKRGFTRKLIKLEKDHDDRNGKPELTEEEFLQFMIDNDVLVPGPVPPTIETKVNGEGMGLWMPENLYKLTSYYKRRVKQKRI